MVCVTIGDIRISAPPDESLYTQRERETKSEREREREVTREREC